MNREDDNRQTDLDWLTKAGFSIQEYSDVFCETILADITIDEQTGWYLFLRIMVPAMEAQLCQCHSGTTHGDGIALTKTSVQSRGDVRRLCSVLGIQLKE